MKYIVFPVDDLKNISQQLLDELHLVLRKNIYDTKVIMKISNYERIFPSIQTLPIDHDDIIEISYPYPVYEGERLKELLSTEEWSIPIEN